MICRKAKFLLLAGMLAALPGCSALSQPRPQPTPAPATPVQAPAAAQPSLDQRMEELTSAKKALDAALKASDKAAFKRAWDQFLSAADGALSHPQAWSIPPGKLPLTLAAEQPDYRVFYKDGYYQYLGDDPTLKNFWVQWKETGGTTRAQVLYRERGELQHEARAYGPLLLLLADGAPARLEAWRLQGNAWQRDLEALAALPKAVGSMEVTRSVSDAAFKDGWWRGFSADGTRREYGAGAPLSLCPSYDSPAFQCYRLDVQSDRVRLIPPDPAWTKSMSDPATIRANLAVGYHDSGKGSADPSVASEAAARAEEGLQGYLRRPLTEQMTPAAFREFFKGTAPGSVEVKELAPNIRVYAITTRPDYQPQERAWVQWWSNPAQPQVQELLLEQFSSFWGAALFGTEPDPVLVYTEGTFPTRNQTGRGVTALRLAPAQNKWIPDTRAFPDNMPRTVGEVAVSRAPGGTGLGMYRPENPPVSNVVRLDAQKQSLTICDTEKACVTLLYQDHKFVVQP